MHGLENKIVTNEVVIVALRHRESGCAWCKIMAL